ncbi:hypothetical protein [Nitrobacter sp.]|uniref:hypothetical protein n=1 Tax=Nitrobacter sp. TaxID=29420 RepID=UPI001D5C6B8F|nr:hypothetical protein [Nitrobacter sp.]MCB1394284.1 hypothetical protein [Nitrobacter sp.]
MYARTRTSFALAMPVMADSMVKRVKARRFDARPLRIGDRCGPAFRLATMAGQ